MAKKLVLFFLTVTAAFAGFSSVTYAEKNDAEVSSELKNPNLLGNYAEAKWQGDALYLDEPSACVYFKPKEEREKYSAVLTFERDESDTGFYFRIDAGNGKDSDSGYCTLSFYDKEHNQLLSLSTGQIQGFDNYSRFYIGEEGSYFPIPENTETVEVALNAEYKGDGDRVNVFFRNLSLHLSGDKPLLLSEKKLYFDSTPGLTKVEIGVTSSVRYFWIVLVFLVAITFYFIRRWQQKYNTVKVMKATDRKNRWIKG